MGWGIPRGKQCDMDAHSVAGVLVGSFLLPLLDDVDLGEEMRQRPWAMGDRGVGHLMCLEAVKTPDW